MDNFKNFCINEGLIKSYDANVVLKALAKIVDQREASVEAVADNKILVNLNENIRLDSNRLNQLGNILNSTGWFISNYFDEDDSKKYKASNYNQFLKDYNSGHVTQFVLEPKYGDALDVSKIKYLYHIAPSKYDKSIQSIGLTPRSQSKRTYHPERIYFTHGTKEGQDLNKDMSSQYVMDFDKMKVYATSGPKSAYGLARTMTDKPSPFSLYQLDTQSLLRDYPSVKFYSDPNMGRGVFTTSNIPAKYLKKVSSNIVKPV